jgi:hypothetical protein
MVAPPLAAWYMNYTNSNRGYRHVPLFNMPATNHVYSRKLVELWTWCKNYLYPPAYKRRRAEKTLTEAYEIHNAEFSTLHRLPGELVLEVADWLDAADIASLHLSCRRHCILLRSRVGRATDGVSKEVQSRLRRERYRRLALQEPRDTTGMDELLCSFCEDAHPRSLFPRTNWPSRPSNGNVPAQRAPSTSANTCPVHLPRSKHSQLLMGSSSALSLGFQADAYDPS